MPASVPLLDLKAQYLSIKEEIDAAIARVVESQHFILGPEVEALESELAAYCNAKYCVALSSGTDALLAALMAAEIGPGDEVITTSFSFFATAGVISRLGARPVFADIDATTFNLDPKRIEACISHRTKAIMPVHLYGQSADMDPINAIAQKYGCVVIEDAAQAIGAEYKGWRVGSLGHMGCFSFFPSKNLGAFGDAGALTTNDESLYRKIKLIRTHGDAGNYQHILVGGNFRIDALQAAILRAKLKHLDTWTEARQRNAAYYTAQFAELGLLGGVVKAPTAVFNRHVYNQYVVRLAGRDSAAAYLATKEIGTRVYYPGPLHLQPCFASYRYREGDLPNSERAARESLALPIFPELTSAQLRWTAECLADFYRNEAAAA